ncbi:MAG: hypothetical protein OER93_01050 [Thermoleophilia bacterium]|nr:hypothetical protein [Thermoleophilia bacterium]
MERFTNIGRPFDFRYPSNVFAVLASVGLGGAALAAGGWDGGEHLGTPIIVGLAAFFSWVLAREIDPDRTQTAAAAAVAGGGLALAAPDAAPAALYLIAVGARILVRTTGLRPKWTDLAVHIPIAAWFAQTGAGWLAAMALAFAIALDAALTRSGDRAQLWWAACMALIATLVALAAGALQDWTSPGAGALAIVALGLLGSIVLLQRETPASSGDRTGIAIDPLRLRLGRILVVVTLAATVLLAGEAGVLGVAGAFVAVAIAGAIRLGARQPVAAPADTG